jgi:hypothetical protein
MKINYILEGFYIYSILAQINTYLAMRKSIIDQNVMTQQQFIIFSQLP